MADVIQLRGLRSLAFCGVLPEEQARPQPLLVDVDVWADLGQACRSDSLADTVDYSALISRLEGVMAGERFALLERLAERLAEVSLEDPRALEVQVTVRKLRPPVPQQIDTTGVSIRRSRAGRPPGPEGAGGPSSTLAEG